MGGGVEREGSNESSGVFVWHTVTTNDLLLKTKKREQEPNRKGVQQTE